MIIEILMTSGVTLIWLIGMFLFWFILNYIKKKSPGLQTLLDLTMLESGSMVMVFATVTYPHSYFFPYFQAIISFVPD